MAYIIENANVLKSRGVEKTSLLIKEERIDSIKPSYKRFSYMRFDAEPFIMTPPHVIFDPDLPFESSFQQIKQYYIEQFIKKGCTLFLTYTTVEKEALLKRRLKTIKTKLLNCPVDFVIGIKIPIELLTPSFMRACKREKIPIVFIDIKNKAYLERVQWGWIREAMFPFNSPLVPMFETTKLKKQAKPFWLEIVRKEKIPHLEEDFSAKETLSYNSLCKIGIIPTKTYIHQGAEVSYNLYMKKDESNHVEQSELFLYHNDRLLYTVHKGVVIRADETVLFRPGFGEHVMINTPAFFTNS